MSGTVGIAAGHFVPRVQRTILDPNHRISAYLDRASTGARLHWLLAVHRGKVSELERCVAERDWEQVKKTKRVDHGGETRSGRVGRSANDP